MKRTINPSSSTSKLDSLASRAFRRVIGGDKLLGTSISETQMAVASSVFYSATSISMVIANKLILSSYSFDYPNVLLLLQCVMSLSLVYVGNHLGMVQTIDRIEKDKLIAWLPVNVFFLLMLLSGFYSLKYLSVPMFMVFKNTNNVLVTLGDWMFFAQPVSGLIVASLVLLIVATLLSAKEDLEFSMEGYAWTFINMFASSGYLLYLRYAMTKTRLSQIGMVVHNNFLSVPLILVVDYLTMQDISRFLAKVEVEKTMDGAFFMLFMFNGIVGSLLSVASFFCVQTTSPTTFSMIGALNKIPMAFLGVYLFGARITFLGACYVALSLVSGGLYAIAKVKQANTGGGNTTLATVTSEVVGVEEDFDDEMEDAERGGGLGGVSDVGGEKQRLILPSPRAKSLLPEDSF